MKHTENIYELLNDMSIDLGDYPKEELSELEKQRLKKTFRINMKKSLKDKARDGLINVKEQEKGRDFKKIGAIALAMFLSIGIFAQTSWGKAVYAATESKLVELSYTIGEALGIERNIAPYAQVVNQVVENQGVEMKLTDAIIDREELILSFLTSTTKPVQGLHFDYDIYLNGKKVKNYSASGTSGPIDATHTNFSTVYSIDIDDIDTIGEVKIKVVLKDLAYYFSNATKEKIKGKWEFEFVASGSELTANTRSQALAYDFYIEDTKYSLQEFRYNPVNQKIYGKAQGSVAASYEVDLRGWDDLGNEVVFYLARVSGEDLTFVYSNIDGDLSNEITSLTLAPYAARLPEHSGKTSDSWQKVGEEFTIYLAP